MLNTLWLFFYTGVQINSKPGNLKIKYKHGILCSLKKKKLGK